MHQYNIIKPANKRYVVVVLSKEDYIKEANRQLNKPVYYQKLPADPTAQYMTKGETMCGLDVSKKMIH